MEERSQSRGTRPITSSLIGGCPAKEGGTCGRHVERGRVAWLAALLLVLESEKAEVQEQAGGRMEQGLMKPGEEVWDPRMGAEMGNPCAFIKFLPFGNAGRLKRVSW